MRRVWSQRGKAGNLSGLRHEAMLPVRSGNTLLHFLARALACISCRATQHGFGYLLILLNIGCLAEKKTPQIRILNDPAIGPVVSREKRDDLRTSEVVKAYPMGRYIEPGSSKVMHEKHTVYRLEGDSGWNMRGREENRGRGDEMDHSVVQAPAVTQEHLAALAEQNVTLEKKLQILEEQHAQLLELKNQNQKLQSELFELKERTPALPQTMSDAQPRIPFRTGQFSVSKSSSLSATK